MIILILITIIMTAATLCGCLKPGNSDICKYDNLEDVNK